MSDKLKKVPWRSIPRIALALLFWLRAMTPESVWVHHLPQAIAHRFQPLWDALQISPVEALPLLTIFFYSLMAKRGWLSLAFDIVYIYAFPLILIGKAIMLPVPARFKESFRKSVTDAKVASQQQAPKSSHPPKRSAWLKKLIAPARTFTVLWCFLVLVSRHAYLTSFSTFAIFVAVTEIASKLWFISNDSEQWAEELKISWTSYLATVSQDLENPDKAKSSHLGHKISFLIGFSLIKAGGSPTLKRLATRSFLLVILLPYYEYMSLLMSFVYVGVAKVVHIRWIWLDAATTAVFLPLTWSRVPNGSLILQCIAGLHSLFLLLVGVEVLIKGGRAKIEVLSKTCNHLADLEETKSMLGRLNPPKAEAVIDAEFVSTTEAPPDTSSD